MSEFTQGAQANKDGHSIHYNPYRERGTAEQYCEWIKGWESVIN
jgi:ribosome modulation factor